MAGKMEDKHCEILDLPDEIITIILLNCDTRTIINFGITCKRFYDLIISTQILWKTRYKTLLQPEMYETAAKYCNGDWYKEFKVYQDIKVQLHNELIGMSPKFYLKTSELTINDMCNFFSIALSNSMSYYYCIYILQNLVIRSNRNFENCMAVKPYTMTEVYYAKMALRYLIHTHLAIKWMRLHSRNELPPEVVINFFLQWIDTDHFHSDEDIDAKIEELVQKVKVILEGETDGSRKKTVRSEKEILAAVTQVIYCQQRITAITAANLDTINIVKVLNNKCGNDVAVAAIYQAVARRCGVHCELVSFPSHLFLEWRNNEYPNDAYTVNINNGELRKKRSCPFSHRNGNDTRSQYFPDYLLQYIFSVFQMSVGAIRNWNTQNASYLLDYLHTGNTVAYNPYKNFLPYLMDLTHLPEFQEPLNIRYMTEIQRNLISSLTNLNIPPVAKYRPSVVKKHDNRIKFGVGMICYHKNLRYMCVVREWEPRVAAAWQASIAQEGTLLGLDQPFYHVIAVDQSDRYVAQENLVEMMRPTRIYHLEDVISREFTHFDGFAYIPNEQKRAEYPDEEKIVDVYRNRAQVIYRSPESQTQGTE